MWAPIPQIVRLSPIRRVRACAAGQGVVSVLEDGLWHLPPPLDWAVQTLVPEMKTGTGLNNENTIYNNKENWKERETGFCTKLSFRF